MKRFATFLLALVMILSLATTAFAAEISVSNAKNNEIYTAYKIFDVSINEAGTTYAYTIAADSPWKTIVDGFTYNEQDVFTLTPSAADANILVVTENLDVDYGAKLAEYLAENLPATAEKRAVTAANDTAVFSDLPAGYYFVDTTLGSLCSLFTTDSTVDLTEKNTIPSITKTQSEEDLQIGNDVTYTITVTDAKGTDAAITVHDIMEDGLTLKADSFKITVDNVDVETKNYTINTATTDGCTFEIEFKADYVKSLNENDEVVITYVATLDMDAEIAPESNDNKTWLNYSYQTTEEVVVKLYSYEFDLDKVDNNDKPLKGAQFKLFDAENNGNVIKVVEVSTGNYRVAYATETGIEEMSTDDNGQLTVTGLDKKVYWLEETVAPVGYNKLTSRETVDLSNGSVLRGEDSGVKVINQAGAELPSTGGVGTTMFYIFGGILVLAAVVLLVTKKRMATAE